MENLINYLLQFGQINQQQIKLIKNKAKVIEIKKKSVFHKHAKLSDK